MIPSNAPIWSNLQKLRLLLPLILMSLNALPSQAASYTFQNIDVPGSLTTEPVSINDQGQIVGTYTDAAGSHGFLYAGGIYQTLTYQGSAIAPKSINNSGEIDATSAGGTPLLYSGGTYTPVSSVPAPTGYLPPGNISSFNLVGLTNAGQLVVSFPLSGFISACLCVVATDFSSTTVAGTFGGHSFPVAFNDQLDILSIYGSPGGAYSYLNGNPIDAPSQQQVQVTTTSLNDSDEVVGYYTVFPGAPPLANNGFIYQNGVSTAFSYPGAASTNLFGINNPGDIIGSDDGDGFLAIPVAGTSAIPEPLSTGLLACGLVVLIARPPAAIRVGSHSPRFVGIGTLTRHHLQTSTYSGTTCLLLLWV